MIKSYKSPSEILRAYERASRKSSFDYFLIAAFKKILEGPVSKEKEKLLKNKEAVNKIIADFDESKIAFPIFVSKYSFNDSAALLRSNCFKKKLKKRGKVVDVVI